MDILQYCGLKAALEAQGCRAKWPNQIKGKMHQKFRKALLKRVKTGRYKLENDNIYYRIKFGATESPQHANDEGWREIPRLADVDNILKEVHEPGPVHLRRDKMKVKLGTQYYWKGMKAAVERVVRCCIRCQKNRRRKNLPKPPLKPMVVIDCCSKYLWAYPIRSKRTGPIALKLFKLFSKEGDPKYLQSDNGKEFVSKCIKALTKLLKAEHKRSRPKHPQTNGTVESVNKNLKAMLREHMANTGCKSWVTALTSTVRQYNDTPHSALPGLTPFQRHRMMVPK
jgi:hypothetical protein